MLYREYKDFNEAFFKFNAEILRHPELMDALCNTMGGFHQIIMEIPSPKCDRIDLGALGYQQGKWSNLVNTYLGSKVDDLRTLGEGVSGLSYSFDFLRKKGHNGSCMTDIVISRDKRKTPWNTLTVHWRTTELQRRWGADLILISRMAELIPNAKFTRFQFQMTSAYQSAQYIIPLVTPVFGVKWSEIKPNHPYTKLMLYRKELYYDVEKLPHNMLSSALRVIELYHQYERGDKLPKITYKECTL